MRNLIKTLGLLAGTAAIYTPSLWAGDYLAGPVVNPANSHEYYLLEQATWAASEATAVALGGHLVTINDAAENQWVFDTFSRYGGVGRALWIGLTDRATEGTWVWVSGDPSPYRYWRWDQPSAGPGEDYAYMWWPGASGSPPGSWNDTPDTTVPSPGVIVNGVVEVEATPTEWQTVLFEDFADGTYRGWSVYSPFYSDQSVLVAPQVVATTGNYAIAGQGNRDPVWLYRPLAIDEALEISLEMRAISGPGWPNHASLVLFHDPNAPFDNYRGMDYGENNRAEFWRYSGLQAEPSYDLGAAAHEWHVFKWTRDGRGYWSFYLDGELRAPDFLQDSRWTSFNGINLALGSAASQIDWARIEVKGWPPQAPSITSPPQSRTSAVGSGATFTVTATGTAPLSYQWRKGGADLADGANITGTTTDTLVLGNVQAASAGDYTVVVTNPYGSVTNWPPAVLTVVDFTLGAWELDGRLPKTVTQPGAASLASGLLVFGGHSIETQEDFRSAFVYSPGGQITPKASMPAGRRGMGVASDGNRVYSIGGYCERSGVDGRNVEVWSYNPLGNVWDMGPSLTLQRAANGGAVLGDWVYTVGGHYDNSGTSVNLVERFNAVAGGAWRPVAPLQAKRDSGGVVSLGGKIYVFGGFQSGTYLDSMEIYDPTLDRWTYGPSMPAPRAYFATAVVGSRFYAIGGGNGTGLLNTVVYYEVNTGQWTYDRSLPRAQCGSAAATLGEAIYLFGGTDANNQSVDTVYRASLVGAALKLTDGLVGYWRLNGDAADSSGFGNHGTVKGRMAYANHAGWGEAGEWLPANQGYVEIADQPQYGFTDSFAVAFWFKATANNPALRYVIQKLSPTVDYGNTWSIFVQDSSAAYFMNAWNAIATENFGNVPLRPGVWNHIAFSYDHPKKLMSSYLNGVLHTQQTPARPLVPLTNPLSILLMRDRGPGNVSAEGWLDEVAIWNRSLSELEVRRLHDGLSPVEESQGRFLSVDQPSRGEVAFTFAGEVGATYTVQGSTDLIHWVDLKTLVNRNGEMVYTEEWSSFPGGRFYRTIRNR